MIIYHCNIAATENIHGPENKYFRSIHCVGATIAIITLYIPVIYICQLWQYFYSIYIHVFEILVIEVNTLLNEILNLVKFFSNHFVFLLNCSLLESRTGYMQRLR